MVSHKQVSCVAKSPQQLKASHCSESKYDANILKSVADTYASMQNYGIQGDIVEGLEEVNSVMSVDKKNMPKVKPMIQKLARARGVPVSFDKDGINVTFKGRPQDVDKLMKDFKKNKTLMKLLEEIQLDEGKLVADVDAILNAMVSEFKKQFGSLYRKNNEKGLAMLNRLGSMIGAKASSKMQQKGKLFLKMELGPDADAGDYIKDFRKSDAPQFKGKSDKKIRQMAIAAYLDKKEK